MKLATTTGDFRIYPTHKERIKHLYDAGFKYIDLSLYEPEDMYEFMQDDWQERAMFLKEYAEGLGMKFVQAHSIGGNPLADDEYENILKMTIRSIEVCGILGIPYTVVHPGYIVHNHSKEDFLRKISNFILHYFRLWKKPVLMC